MKKLLIKTSCLLLNSFLLIFLLSSYFVWGQENIVPNNSFEYHTACPDSISREIIVASPWTRPLGTPDYFNICDSVSIHKYYGVPNNFSGSENAHSGVAYAGLLMFYNPNHFGPNVREYVEVPLLDTLKTGKKYYTEFYVSLADSSQYAVNKIGAYFSINETDYWGAIAFNYQPQVESSETIFISNRNGWTKISGTFIANGGERYMTIGNLRNDANTNTTFINLGIIGEGKFYAYYYLDDVLVMEDTSHVGIEEQQQESKIKVYPNPANGTMHLEYNLPAGGVFGLYDVVGQKVFQLTIDNGQWTKIIDVSGLTGGVYFWRVGERAGKVVVSN